MVRLLIFDGFLFESLLFPLLSELVGVGDGVNEAVGVVGAETGRFLSTSWAWELVDEFLADNFGI